MEDKIRDLERQIMELKFKKAEMVLQIESLRRQIYYSDRDRARLEILEGLRIEKHEREQEQ